MNELALPPLCRWSDGLLFALIIGWLVVEIYVWGVRRLGRVPAPTQLDFRAWLFTTILSTTERAIFLSLTVGFPPAALGFAPVWMGLKLAANWNRAGRLEAFEWDKATTDKEKWERVSRGVLSALFGSLLSISFGIVGGLIVRPTFGISLFC